MNTPDDIKINRKIKAKIDSVWEMWTQSSSFQNWYGPEGARIPKAEMNVELGGKRHICMEMQTPNGPMQMWFIGEYLEIEPNNRLVYTESMSNEAGETLSPSDMGMPEGHPETTKVIVELNETNGVTDMTMTHVGVPAGSPGEAGWNMALDKLEKML